MTAALWQGLLCFISGHQYANGQCIRCDKRDPFAPKEDQQTTDNKARLDPDGSAKPKTMLVAHAPADTHVVCHYASPDWKLDYQDENGNRVSLNYKEDVNQ
jgi:hypothetical protein